MPFLCASLALIGWTDEISAMLHANSVFLQQYSPATITIALIAVFITMFSFFNMFVSSVFCYLFNDVVPPQFLARFTGAFRIVGVGASTLYTYFIYGYAESNMREIFLSAAVLYFIGFGMMCLMVKEGKYPPTDNVKTEKKPKMLDEVKTFFRESFSHKIYWLLFSFTAVGAAGGAIGTFTVFFYKNSMGLDLLQIGKMFAACGVASLLAAYFASIYVDRWHPLRVITYLSVFGVTGAFMSGVWVFVTLPANYFFWLSLGSGVISAFLGAFTIAGSMPLFYKMFPQSRFGQFCSAQSILVSFIGLGTGVSAGLYLDIVQYFCNDANFAYRFIFLWSTAFSVLYAVIIILIYKIWYRLGGDHHFHPPAPWNPDGVEHSQVVPTIGPQSRWLNISFRLFNAVMAVSTIGILPLMFWMYFKHTMVAFSWHAWLLLPLSMIAWLYWKYVEKNIQRDIEKSRRNEPLKNGIPHHGVFIIVASDFLLVLGLWFVQVVVAVNLNMDFAAIIFTVANVITNFMLIGSVQLLCRIERGFSTKIDEIFSAASWEANPK
jgi:MFS family permease